MDPIVLPANQPADRFYLGGSRIAQFRGRPSLSDRVPEDWIASTTTMAGHPELGLTTLPSGRLLRDEIAADPVSWLGAEHMDRYGTDTKLLVKLLHAGQRLPVHAHPDTEFALRLLARPHGKAEAWYILNGGDVYLGLKEDIDPAALLALVEKQEVETLLSLLHRRRVEPGDTVYVPAGVLHAIGEDTFVAEVQEPEDLSILLEWRDFELDGRADGHLGLGFETALGAVDIHGRSEAEISALITSGGQGDSVLAPASSDYFRLGRYPVSGQAELGQGFAVAIVTEGSLRLESASIGGLDVDRGATIVVPYAAGPLTASGRGEILLCRPPALYPPQL